MHRVTGQVLSFVPLMAITFVLLSVLEDSGYLARAAFVVDRLMRLIGLPGRAFLPLIVGFGCNVPALAGTRILADRRHRLLTGLLIPFVTCSARPTEYVLVASVFFGNSAGTVVFAMYVLSIVLVICMGMLLRGPPCSGAAAVPAWPTGRGSRGRRVGRAAAGRRPGRENRAPGREPAAPDPRGDQRRTRGRQPRRDRPPHRRHPRRGGRHGRLLGPQGPLGLG